MKSARLFRLVFFGFFALSLLQCDIPDQKEVVASISAPELPPAPPPPPPPPPPAKITRTPRTPASPVIDYWQDATWDGGPVLFNEILEKAAPEEIMVILLWLGMMYELGYDIYAVRVRFSNPNDQSIVVSPKQFRVNAGWGGQSYPLELFLVPRNGYTEHWETVNMPGGSSVELYGYYAAPQYFRGSTLSVR
jgi:hypothetical protein